MKRKKRRKVKREIKITTTLVCIILLVFAGILYTKTFKNNSSNVKDNDNKVIKALKKEENIKKIKLLATGDGLIHSVIFKSYQNANGGFDFTPALSDVKDIVSDYDIAYYNQETPMGDATLDYSGYPRFYVPKEFGDAMMDAGFNTVSLASNHSLDRGEAGILQTVKYYKTTNFLYNGINDSKEMRNNYIIKEKNGITYTLLSYTTLTNGLSVPAGKDYLLNIYDEEKVKEDIKNVRDKVDVLIVAMHWGEEYQSTPNDSQKQIAKTLTDAGVDIIIGNHPHILQPITKINDTIVMYSLGNFISNQYGNDDYNKLVGFMATLDITKKDKEIIIDNLGGEMIFTKYDGNPLTTAVHSNHKVIPFSKMTDNRYLNDYERIYNKYADVLKSYGENINITPIGGSVN